MHSPYFWRYFALGVVMLALVIGALVFVVPEIPCSGGMKGGTFGEDGPDFYERTWYGVCQ